MVARLRAAADAELELRTNGAVLAQVWRQPVGRQAALARLLRAVDVVPVDRRLGQEAGVLAGRAGTDDAVDATVVAMAAAGDRIVTGDPDDVRSLVAVAGRPVLVVPC